MKDTIGSERQKSSALSHLLQRPYGITRDAEGEDKRKKKDTGTRIKKNHELQDGWMVRQQFPGRRSETRPQRVTIYASTLNSHYNLHHSPRLMWTATKVTVALYLLIRISR